MIEKAKNVALDGPYTWADGIPRAHLPSDDRLSELTSKVSKHQIVLYEGSTGVGKTLRNPQALALEFPDQQIIVYEPTRLLVKRAALSIAKEVGQVQINSENTENMPIVSYRLQGETKSNTTVGRIDFRVIQSLLAELAENHGKLPNGILIIDEVHTNKIDMHVILGLLKLYLPAAPDTRVVLQSATPDIEQISRFFPDIAKVSCHARLFPVTRHSLSLEKYQHHSAAAINKVTEMISEFVAGRLSCHGITKDSGQILLLMPGQHDINKAISTFTEHSIKLGCSDCIQCIDCHSKSSEQSLDLLDAPIEGKKLRIVVGTDYAREGITLQHTYWVVDSGQVKRDIYSHENGVTNKLKRSVTLSEVDQAVGRLGRVDSGEYYLVEGSDESNQRVNFATPATHTSSLTSLCLMLAKLGVDSQSFPLLYPLNPNHLEQAIKRLKALGLLDQQGLINEVGSKVLSYRTTAESGMALYTARRLGVLAEVATALAFLEIGNPFQLDFPKDGYVRIAPEMYEELKNHPTWESIKNVNILSDNKKAVTIALDFNLDHDRELWRLIQTCTRMRHAYSSKSDFVAGINLLNYYRSLPKGERKSWCVDQMLNPKQLQRCSHFVEQLQRRLNFRRQDQIVGEDKEDKIHASIVSGYPELLLNSDRVGYYVGQGQQNIKISYWSLAKLNFLRTHAKKTAQTKFLLSAALRKYLPFGAAHDQFEYSADFGAHISSSAVLLGIESLLTRIPQQKWRVASDKNQIEQSFLFRFSSCNVAYAFRPAGSSPETARFLVNVLINNTEILPNDLLQVIIDNDSLRQKIANLEKFWKIKIPAGMSMTEDYLTWLEHQVSACTKISEVQPEQIRLPAHLILRQFMQAVSKIEKLSSSVAVAE